MVNNLGYITDSYFLEEAREIIVYPDYTFVRSPNQPNFYFGNYLLLNASPTNGDKEKWEQIFKNHFTDERVKHFTFCWSGEDKSGVHPFLDGGYKLEELAILTAKATDLMPLREKNTEVNIREFQSKEDWAEWITLEYEEKPEGFSASGFMTFLEGKAAIYQQLNQKDCGNFYGAYIDNRLIASAGLFYQNEMGRFQSVKTKATFRKRGICKTLLHHMCVQGFQKLDTLVIAADKDYHAIKIYQKLGFKQTASQTSVYWHEA